MWDLEAAVNFCRDIERLVTPHWHVALTGGCLYKFGMRKDIDVVLYQCRQSEIWDKDGLLETLELQPGLKIIKDFGFCVKAKWYGHDIDFLIPETPRTESDGNGGYH